MWPIDSVLFNLFSFALVHNYTSDDKLRTVVMPECLAVELVYHLFDAYVDEYVFYVTALVFFISLFCIHLANKRVQHSSLIMFSFAWICQ